MIGIGRVGGRLKGGVRMVLLDSFLFLGSFAASTYRCLCTGAIYTHSRGCSVCKHLLAEIQLAVCNFKDDEA